MTSKHDQGLALERALSQAEEMLQEFESNNPIEPLEPMNSATQTLVLVDGIPRVDMSKYEKLCTIIRKIFSQYGSIVDDGYYVPVAGTPPMTLGYCIIEFTTIDEARRACAEGDFKKLDAAHTLRVTPYDDYEKLQKMPDVYVPPDAKEYSQKSQLHSWLLDEYGRDQFVIRHGSETQIYWHDPVRKANEQGRTYQYGGEREKERGKTWTESYVAWSPRGSYFATFHQQGIALWGGEQFEKLQRMAHTGVSVIDFSPNEKYLITSNGTEQEKKTDPECLIVWDVRSGNKLRGFEKGIASTWPVFKWSHDDSFIARTGRDMISVYEVPSMGLLDKKSIKVPDVQDIAWSPSDNLLSYWVPEKANTPAVVAIVELPSKRQVRERHFYNVSDLKMHWQDAGEYLCVKFLRRKTKTKMTTSFEIFRMKQKDIPVEVVELSDAVIAFAWEPKGHRFAIIHGDAQKPNVSIYTMEKKKVALTKTFESRSANCLFWSPLGSHLVVAGLGTFNGQLEFFDIDSLESLGTNEHFMCTDVDWDPSGRYVCTAVTQPLQHGSWKHAMENGYRMWTHQGALLTTQPYENLYQVLWRPRPPTLLSASQIAELRRTLRDRYWRRFESEDDEIRRSQLSGRERDRDQLKQAWKQYRITKEKEYQEEAAKRQALRGGIPSEDETDYEIVEQWVEEEMSREEELAPL